MFELKTSILDREAKFRERLEIIDMRVEINALIKRIMILETEVQKLIELGNE